METKRSIRDISSPNSGKIISDIVSEPENIVVKKTRKITPSPIEEVNIKNQNNTSDTKDIYEEIDSNNISNKIPGKNIISNLFSKIKITYLIGILIILILLSIFIFVPSSNSKDPLEQAKKEAEMVKKELSKHMVLPENEQIDIRKITSKVEDPFFQNAEIGDYLIIFYENRIAYIYSINKNLIINAGVVFIDPKTATTTNKTSQ